MTAKHKQTSLNALFLRSEKWRNYPNLHCKVVLVHGLHKIHLFFNWKKMKMHRKYFTPPGVTCYLLMVRGQKNLWQPCWVMWIICQNVWSICIFSSTLKFQQVLQTWIGSKLHFYPNLTWLQHECKQWSSPTTRSNLEKVTQIST